VRGQYKNYRRERGVAAESDVETFAAMRVHSTRGAGKACRFTFASASGYHQFHRSPRRVASAATRGVRPSAAAPNYLRFHLEPDVRPSRSARVPSAQGWRWSATTSSFTSATSGARRCRQYERLIGDALKGDATLFARQDAVEAAWRIVDPIVDRDMPVHRYAGGTWGPVEVDALIANREGWHNPRLAARAKTLPS
jgi:glucose-6-phosphate 1-dehydrogenase